MQYASGDPTDLLAPAGELSPALFPLETVPALADRLAAWMDAGWLNATNAGVTDTSKADEAAVAFAHYRYYDGALQRIIANPTTSNFLDKGGSSYGSTQLDMLERKAEGWRIKYEALLVLPASPVTPEQRPQGAQPATFVW